MVKINVCINLSSTLLNSLEDNHTVLQRPNRLSVSNHELLWGLGHAPEEVAGAVKQMEDVLVAGVRQEMDSIVLQGRIGEGRE